MGVINKQTRKYIIVVILLIVEVMTISLVYKSFGYRNELDEVNKLGKNNGMFAIFIKEAGETEYTRSNDDEFPSGYYELNTTRSGCIDSAGNSLESVTITYEEGEIEVKTNQSLYCYLYFDFNLTADKLEYDNTIVNKTTCDEAQCAIDELYDEFNEFSQLEILKSGISDTLVAGLYRYQGTTDVNNYICFGTTDKDTCISDTDKYMYRIIGNTSNNNVNNQMKLIKKEALNTAYAWHGNRAIYIEWPDSDLFDGLNGSYFLTNTNYVPSGWENRIATTTWKYGDIRNTSATIQEITTTELGFSDTVNAKIGLMYIHDYVNGLPNGYNCTTSGLCEVSWIHLCQLGNDLNAPSCIEWSILHYAHRISYNQSWVLKSFASEVESKTTDKTFAVRPVFYLTSSQEIASGSGTLNDPFILS